jgi:hypothetical protein
MRFSPSFKSRFYHGVLIEVEQKIKDIPSGGVLEMEMMHFLPAVITVCGKWSVQYAMA